MQNLFSGIERPLPELLQEDLEELLVQDNHSALTWVRLDESDDAAWRRFRVRYWSDGRRFALTLEFGIPPWMTQRGVEAILPAHLAVSEIEPGTRASAAFGLRTWAQLQSDLPRISRTCARLMNELWGVTGGEDLMLVGIELQEPALPTPYPQVRGLPR